VRNYIFMRGTQAGKLAVSARRGGRRVRNVDATSDRVVQLSLFLSLSLSLFRTEYISEACTARAPKPATAPSGVSFKNSRH
jgi:hypothetical protein